MAAKTLKIPTTARPFQSDKATGADAGFLRQLIAPKEAEVVTVEVFKSGAAIPFRVQGNGTDDGAEDGDGYPRPAGAPFPYSRDLGQQNRKGPALTAWSIFVVCDQDAADIHIGTSFHRNN